MAITPDAPHPTLVPTPEFEPAPRAWGKSTSIKQMRREARQERLRQTPEEIAEEAEMRAEVEANRPRTRADCVNGPRPCPYVSCSHHLAVSVHPETGSLKLTWPDKELWELEHSCALDIVDANPNGLTLEEVGQVMNLTRERVRQLEDVTTAKVRAAVEGESPTGLTKCRHCLAHFIFDRSKAKPAYCSDRCKGEARAHLLLVKGGGAR